MTHPSDSESTESRQQTARQRLVGLSMLAAFLLFTVWQVMEFAAWRRARWAGLDQRAEEVSAALVSLVNQQNRYGFMLSRERLEEMLGTLVQSNDGLSGIVLYNAEGEILAQSHGEELPADWATGGTWSAEAYPDLYYWARTYSDLPQGTMSDTATAVVLDRETLELMWSRLREGRRSEREASADSETPTSEPRPAGEPRPPRQRPTPEQLRARIDAVLAGDATLQESIRRNVPQKTAFVMNAAEVRQETARDLLLRSLVVGLAALALWATWRGLRNLRRSAALSVELVREREKNRYLQDMHLAAAGLAHETRNPLNVVRGIAQGLPRHADDPARLAAQTETIVDEGDRINSRLSQFIAYSKPRHPQHNEVELAAICAEITNVMSDEAEEKQVTLSVTGEALTISADREMLRQVLFNLTMNALAAVADGGHVTLAYGRSGEHAWLAVKDDGPGVPIEARDDIVKPYFTLNPAGTGLGLAVVQQIANAHGWTLSYQDAKPHGAVFRIEPLPLAH